MITSSASAKMEALGAVLEQLLLKMERSDILKHDQTDRLLMLAAESLVTNESIRSPTRENAQSYVDQLREFVRKGRVEGEPIASR